MKRKRAIVKWEEGTFRRGSQMSIVNKKGNHLGALEILSEPQVAQGDNDEYVTISMRAAVIKNGLPTFFRDHLDGYEFKNYTEFGKAQEEIYDGLKSLMYMYNSFLEMYRKQECCLLEFVYSLEQTRISFFFHYVLIERRILAHFDDDQIKRFREIGKLAEEGFVQVYNRYWKNKEEINPLPALEATLNAIMEFYKEI